MMLYRVSLFLTCGMIVLMHFSCSRKDSSNKLLAEVEGEKLYLSEIYFPENLSSEDSINFLKIKVDNWVIEQLMYLNAESKLSDDVKQNIEKQIEQSRKLMIISALEENMVTDSMKVEVTSEEAQNYYRENPTEFLLKENIVKVMYVKLNKKGSNTAQFKTLLFSDKTTDKSELTKKASEEALNYFLEDNVWLYFNDILKEIPIKVENQKEFLKSNTFYELSNDSVVYYVRFNGYLLSESQAPFVLVKEQIQSVILAKKKNQLLDDYRNKIYENALKEKKVNLYID